MKVKKITIPEGWEIDKVKNGKIILKKSKKELPKTWEECYKLLGKGEYIEVYSKISKECKLSKPCKENHNTLPVGLGKPLLALCQLLICREVYRDGWKPNLSDKNKKYCIYIKNNTIQKEILYNTQRVLSFQSEEICDQFIKNFHNLIEEAKELI